MKFRHYLPFVVFIAVFVLHFGFRILSKTLFSPWVVDNSQIPLIIQGYFDQRDYFLGFSYALATAFMTFTFINYLDRRRSSPGNLKGVFGGLSLVSILSIAGCFLIGCCGSPMLAIYAGIFGVSFLGVTKPIIAGLTLLSVIYGFYRIRKDNNCNTCAEGQCSRQSTENVAGLTIDSTAKTQAIKEISLKVKGLDCPECALPLEKVLKTQTGISTYNFLFTAEKVSLTYDENIISLADIKQLIQRSGLKVVNDAKTQGIKIDGIITFAFVGFLAVLLLVEIVFERLGILEAVLVPIPNWLLIGAVLVGGYPIFKSALQNLLHKEVNTDLIMTVGITAASVSHELSAALLIVFFVRIAHFLESFTVDRSRQAINELIKLAPTTAWIKKGGKEVEVNITDIIVGDTIVVKPGERIPVDGIVSRGVSAVDQATITGESTPVRIELGSQVFASTMNQSGHLEIKVNRVGADTTLGKIIHLVEEAETNKAPIQKFADRFSGYYLPLVILVATATYLFTRNLSATIAVLVVACPCAVALSTPMAVVAATGRAAKQGILIKGGRYLELLAKVNVLLVDKTGTLTFGRPQVTDIISVSNLTSDDILSIAASVERYSEHVLAKSVLDKAAELAVHLSEPDKFSTLAGKGVIASIKKQTHYLGNQKLLHEQGITINFKTKDLIEASEKQGKTVLILANRKEGVLGLLAITDIIRNEVKPAIETLKKLGFKKIIMLTGDNKHSAQTVASALGIDCQAELLPEDKIQVVKDLQERGYKVAMVGDGVNDAPSLSQADVGIGMGAAGTDIALEAADVVLMGDDWNQLPEAIAIAKKTFSTIKQNIALGIGFDIVGMGLASIGFLPPVFAAAAQSFPDVAVFLNSARLLKRTNT